MVHFVEKYGHKLERLSSEAIRLWRCEVSEEIKSKISECEKLPVGLRYSLDAFDYLEANEEIYYQTIGSSEWMKQVEELAEEARKRLQEMLSRRSKIVTVSAANVKELLQEGFNKFRSSKELPPKQ